MAPRSSTRSAVAPGDGGGLGGHAGPRQQPARRLRRRRRQARAGLVHQPRQRRPGRDRRGLLDRRLHDHHPGPAPGRRPAAHPAGAPARGQGPAIDLMSLDPPFTAEFADAGFLAEVPQDAAGAARGAGHLPGRARRGDVEGRARRLPVLVQHPGPLVPQVLRREGRHRHVAAGDLGPDHRRRQRERRQDRRAGQQVRGLRRLDQRPRRGRRRTHPRGRRQGRRRRRSRSTTRPARTRRASSRSSPRPRPHRPT